MEDITPTQPNYPGTALPRSFVIKTDGETLWVHGNATEHMYEAMISIKESPRLKGSNPNLYSQFILYDYYKSLSRAVRKGINYKTTVRIGNWEFAFAPARNGQNLPVVKHALFTGFEK